MDIKAGDLSGWAQMLVALLALWYTIIESRRSRKERHDERLAAAQQRADEREAGDLDRRLRARPILNADKHIDERDRSLRYTLKNVGLGPAKILELRPSYRGARVDRIDIQAIVNEFGISECRPDAFIDTLSEHAVLPVGEEWVLLDLTFFRVDADFKDVTSIADAIDFGVKFASIYDDIFEVEKL